MSCIELKHVDEKKYNETVKPFRFAISNLKDNEFQRMLAHDNRHFIEPVRSLLINDPKWRILTGDFFKDVLPNLDSLSTALSEDILKAKIPDNSQPRIAASWHRAKVIAPHIPKYMVSLLDSMKFMQAIREDDHAQEIISLNKLYYSKVPVSPICYYLRSSTINIDDQFHLNGLEGLVLQNLLANSYKSGIPLSQDNDPNNSFSEYKLNENKILVTNFSEFEVNPVEVTSKAFIDCSGLFIANMYAQLSNKKLKLDCLPVKMDSFKQSYPNIKSVSNAIFKIEASF